MLIKIDFGAIGEIYQQRAGLGVTLTVNWLIKPFTMAFMAWLFLRHVFADWLPAEQIDSYVAGLILLGAAPCTAMVFVWSSLCRGSANFTLTQVAINDLVMVFAFAPHRRVAARRVVDPGALGHLLLSVVMYIRHPLAIAQFIRARLLRRGDAQPSASGAGADRPFSILALLATLVLLFSFRAKPSSRSR